jgi:uncharacterized protein (TIGR02646 family)
MIRIVKPSQPPPALRDRGPEAIRKLCDDYDQAPADYGSGAKTFEFNQDLYGARSVKTVLREAQHGKCAFCESKFAHTGYGDVEHFRPKAGYAQRDGDELGRPGYYWLAYEWSNLSFSCQLCNQRFKRNLFPLKRPTTRARSHHDRLDDEEALVIDPTRDDPGRSLGFREEYAYPIRGQLKGRMTIEVLGLNREELVEVRRDRLVEIKLLREARKQLAEALARDPTPERRAHLEKVEKWLRERTEDREEFAAMARAALG